RSEVGSDPGQLAISPAEFHACAQQRGPASLLATATHDHKRGEDVRARLAVLSEIPDEWSAAAARWFRLNARLRDPQLDPGDEYQLYQTLVGSWPLELACDDRAALAEFSERILGWRLKSLHEEKIHTSWGDPDARYDRASGAFVRQLLDPACSAEFLRDLADFVQTIAPAAALNGLSQTVLKCTCPGIPDFYQGTELWDLSMVDPDNRRAIDFAVRVAALASEPSLPALLAEWRNGFVKQRLIAELLRLRTQYGDVFARGDYVPVRIEGSRRENAVAFLRTMGRPSALVAVPRLSARACIEAGAPLPKAEFWGDTELSLPAGSDDCRWREALASLPAGQNPELRCSALFARFPAAVLISES
ncbi:MAG TPA: hypothetical protein VKR31_17975, partial [Rhizomicrobium sp.]|nr:hypothetical protein [Rhizomicrobium sp.]